MLRLVCVCSMSFLNNIWERHVVCYLFLCTRTTMHTVLTYSYILCFTLSVNSNSSTMIAACRMLHASTSSHLTIKLSHRAAHNRTGALEHPNSSTYRMLFTAQVTQGQFYVSLTPCIFRLSLGLTSFISGQLQICYCTAIFYYF